MILDEIIFNKRQEVTVLKAQLEANNVEGHIKESPKPLPFLKKGGFSLIAEIKKASPSAGVIRKDFDPVSLARTYEKSGAAAVSVLTDEKFFQGKLADLMEVKKSVSLPILRKDFIIDKSQIYQSRIAGADAILLIAAVLEHNDLVEFIYLVEQLGMQALVEVHTADEAKSVLNTQAKIIGINNRDLHSFKVDLNTTLDLIKKFPDLKKRTLISESGISTSDDIKALKKAGVDGVLIGESILKSDNIPAKIKELIG